MRTVESFYKPRIEASQDIVLEQSLHWLNRMQELLP